MSNIRNQNLIKYVLPTVLSSVCFFLFTIVDGIFVGHGVGTNALGAVNLVLPFTMIANALFMLTTIGGVTIVAIRLGRGDQAGANQALLNSVGLTVIIACVLSGTGVFFCDFICALLGATDTFHDMAADYLFWYALFLIPSGLSVMLQGFCRNDGSPVLVSVSVIVSTVFNIFGDWLLIFPIPLGLKGAAIATGVSQTLGLLIVLTHYIRKKGVLRLRTPHLQGALTKKILLRGLPESISQLATPVTTICMNRMLMQTVGEIGVNAFSIISYVASFSIAIFFGTGEGLQPLFGQAYGAQNEKDLKYYFRAGLWINFIGSVAINLLLLLVGGRVCALFGADPATLQFTVQAMPMYAWGFTVMSFNVMISSYLYSTKRSIQAIVINVLRSFLFNSIVIFTLPLLIGADFIWATFGVYEALVLVVAVVLLKGSQRKGILFQ